LKRSIFTGCIASVALILLILDTKTAIYAIQDAVNLCLMTVIPSLLPFFILTTLLTANLTGFPFRLLRPLESFCKMSSGTGIVLISGLLGGYPAGAQTVGDAYSRGRLCRENAQRLLGFCSNAGPAFIFGIAAGQFSSPYAGWMLWTIQILACLAVARLMPGDFRRKAVTIPRKEISLKEAVERSGQSIAKVCLWIIVFRVILGFAEHWLLWMVDPYMQVLITGIMELTLGATQLSVIPSEGLRFLICSGMLAFGGICVAMQTASSIGDLEINTYIQGKIMQSVFAAFIAFIIQYIWLPESEQMKFSPGIMVFLAGILVFNRVFFEKKKKYCSKISAVGV